MIIKLCKLLGILTILPLILALNAANAAQSVSKKGVVSAARPAQVMILAKGQNHLPDKSDQYVCRC